MAADTELLLLNKLKNSLCMYENCILSIFWKVVFSKYSKYYCPKIIKLIWLPIQNCCALTSSKTPFVCMKTVSCQTIEKTNRLGLKKI